MNPKAISIVCALALPIFTFVPATSGAHRREQPEKQELDVRDIAPQAKISLREAIGKALAAQPGRAVEAELECEVDAGKRDFFYEVMVLTAEGKLVEVQIDPVMGGVKSKSEAEDDEDEVPGFAAALRHSELDLATLVERAEGFLKGTPVSAELEYERGGPECSIAFVHTRYVLEATLETRAGHLLELERECEHFWNDEGADDREFDDEDEDSDQQAGDEDEDDEEDEGDEGEDDEESEEDESERD